MDITKYTNFISTNKTLLFVLFIIMFFVYIVFKIKKYISRKRISTASSFGKSEHKAGRWLGILILLGFIVAWYFNSSIYVLIFIGLIFICWLIYIISHTLEKWFYGNRGFR